MGSEREGLGAMVNSKICPACGNSYDAANLFCPLDSTPLRSSTESGELVGSVIAGRYLISNRIGIGGMGEVYRAQDVRLQRPVAIKVLHASLGADVDAIARFSREAANCSKINNQHVVHVHDFGETEEGLAYLAMEFVQGQSLKALIDSEGPLAPERVVTIVSQIASGLDAAHRLDCPVVHRDLKPDNVLVTQDQDGAELVKVADFGISKAIRDDSQRVTKTGFVTGTYEFMSPEQVTGGVVDQRSDVYTLGLIAFMMLTGELPFPGRTPQHSMLMRLNEAPSTLRAIRPEGGWPDELQRVMDRVLARDPSQRYDSAGQFARDFARSLERKNQAVGKGGGRWPRRAVWAAATVVSLALAAGVVALLANWPPARDTAFVPGAPDMLVPLTADSARNDPAQSDSASITPTVPPVAVVPPTTPDVPKLTPTKPRARPAGPKAPAPRPMDQGRPALERYETVLHPDMPRDSALLALAALDALMPRLQSARDSVDADLYRAEATALAGQSKEACAILEQARPRATELQRRKIELWADQGICTASDWRSS